jgi:hypothetical protein
MAEADPNLTPTSKRDKSLASGHLERSRLLDAFAKLEISINALLAQLKIEVCQTAPIGQRLGKIGEKELSCFGNPKFAQRAFANALVLAEERNSIVHAKLCGTSPSDQKQGWKFINTGNAQARPLVLTLEDFEERIRNLMTLANQFNQLKKQAQAPTSPAATSAKSSAH